MKQNNFYLPGLVLLVALFGQSLNAQSNAEEIDLYQSIFGMEKKAIVADFLQLDANDPFWVLYDEYETNRKDLGKDRVQLLQDYVNNYEKHDDESYDAIISRMKKLRNATDKLMDTYYKKVKKSSGSKVAAQFFQLEAFFLSEIRAGILEGVPFFGEFD